MLLSVKGRCPYRQFESCDCLACPPAPTFIVAILARLIGKIISNVTSLQASRF